MKPLGPPLFRLFSDVSLVTLTLVYMAASSDTPYHLLQIFIQSLVCWHKVPTCAEGTARLLLKFVGISYSFTNSSN